MQRFITTLIFAPLLLAGCSLFTGTATDGSSSSSASSEAVRETPNVTYTGTIEPAGISIYQQGTHRLTLTGGRFILLESEELDLNGYVGEEVQVFGSLRPTVEAGGMIMRVDRVQLLNGESSASSEDSSESADSSDASSEATSSRAQSSQTTTSRASVASVQSVTSVAASSRASTASAELEARIEVMARQDYSSNLWTQQYCTLHIEFCIPVHRNWWFISFGTTSSALWHVEFSSEPFENVGEGPIVLELLAGSAGNLDGVVRTEGGMVVGYKEWTDGRHFRLSGDARLEVPIRHMIGSITEYTEE